MRVTAGERSVHIIPSYDEADALMSKLGRVAPGSNLYGKLAINVPAGRAKGYPKPPLPKSNVAHNSDVEIVDDVPRSTGK